MPRRNPPASTRRISRRADDLTTTTASRTSTGSSRGMRQITPEQYRNLDRDARQGARALVENGRVVAYYIPRKGT